MNRYAIYTAVVGGYDNIYQPCVVDDRFDYYLFSNDIQEERVGVWNIRNIPYHHNDPTRVARWVKTHPEQLLPDYACSVWMDCNIQIADGYIYSRAVQACGNGELVASVQHLGRNCIYDEAAAVLADHFDHEKVVLHWVKQLKKRGYPRNNGLFETNILFRVHNNTKIEAIDKAWWECINQYSKRDQLSFNYLLWRFGIHADFVLQPPEVAGCSPHVNYYKHASGKSFEITKDEDPFFYYFRLTGGNETFETQYSIYSRIISHRNPYKFALAWGRYRLVRWKVLNGFK